MQSLILVTNSFGFPRQNHWVGQVQEIKREHSTAINTKNIGQTATLCLPLRPALNDVSIVVHIEAADDSASLFLVERQGKSLSELHQASGLDPPPPPTPEGRCPWSQEKHFTGRLPAIGWGPPWRHERL